MSRRVRVGQKGQEEEVGGGGKKAAEAAEGARGEEKGKRVAYNSRTDVQKGHGRRGRGRKGGKAAGTKGKGNRRWVM